MSDNPTDVTVETSSTDDQRTHITDDTVTYAEQGHRSGSVEGRWPVEADNHVRALIERAESQRQAIEDKRANHRNFNRMLTLLGALVIGLFVTYTLEHKGVPGLVRFPAWTESLAPYSFVITVALDSMLALYSFIRHY